MKAMLFTTLLASACIQAVYAQEAVQERKLQAAFLYNILKYIEWPDENEGDKFVIGVMGSNEAFEALKSSYEGKPKGSKKCQIQKIVSVNDLALCSVVFLSREKSKDFDQIKNVLGGKSILSVTEKEELGRKGSCINFVIVDGKYKFELNRNVMADYNLKVSGALVSMAIVI